LSAVSGTDRIRMVLLFGGRSAEHEVSCISALHVLQAIDPARYEVVPVGITRSGTWVVPEQSLEELTGHQRSLPSPDEAEGEVVHPAPLLGSDPGVVVFPLLHGPMGEDGTVQGLLELSGVPYVGAGVAASALCMDKALAKRVLDASGVPGVGWIGARRPEVGPGLADRVEEELGYPVFVKPANLGSSVGVSRVREAEGLAGAVDTALRYDEYLIIEEAVTAREIEVAVLGNETPRASAPGEVRPSHEFYDFEDKYLDEGAGLLIPAPLSPEEAEEVQSLALRAYRALQVDGLARVDFFYEEAGRGFLVNELNTLPGFTPISMYPRLWAHSGVAYPALVDQLVDLALDRHRRRSTFETVRP
jgi:D-alanine-D-alanine ligase